MAAVPHPVPLPQAGRGRTLRSIEHSRSPRKPTASAIIATALHILERTRIDHVGFSVPDFAHAKAFYERALAPLGYRLVMETIAQQTGKLAAGFGANGKPDFWIGGEGQLEKPVHIALLAKDRATVDEFYRAALAAGGRDNGSPGLRPHYHPNYYGAFVLDPDGHNIEAVCHMPA